MRGLQMAPRAALLWVVALVCIAARGRSQPGFERRFLVRFSSRLFQSQQAELLRNASALTGSRHRYIYRANSAAKLPSDHGVIAASEPLEQLRDRLEQVPGISGVFVDSALRSLSSAHGPRVYKGSRVVSPMHQRLLQARNQSNPRSSFRVLPSELGRPLHAMGFRGAGIKVAVFDTGLAAQHRHFKNVKERTNWTNEKTLADLIGHGTFVAGVVASADEKCAGVAPEVELYVFRVFTKDRVSYTSWFLDAFNYAMFLEVDVLNLSIGGPDYLDQPFVDKVNELTANGVIVVSAIGNDGPVFGSLNNPADQPDVIGVGGIGADGEIAPFSSRGMTLSPVMHGGYGQVKPDVVTEAQFVVGSALDGGCRELSGTSMASPVVAGAIALLIQSIPESKRPALVNPASIKQLLHASARRLRGPSVFEQGAGAIDLARAHALAESFVPHASIFPAKVSNSESSCPHMWPWCRQPVFHTSQPLLFNLTVLNSVAVVSRVVGVRWTAASPEQQHVLRIDVDHSNPIWPWSGWLGVSVRVREASKDFIGVVRGNLTVALQSVRDGKTLEHEASVELEVQVIATPPRNRRLLWDQFHSIHYPSPYVPRDNLRETRDTFDWNGDHPHTNFARLFDTLRAAGFFVEVLGEGGWDCFDASNYAALLLVDPEDDFDELELRKLEHDLRARGLGLLVVADWHEEALLPVLSFFDDNTRSTWFPVVGGANVPALNRLLRPFGAALGDGVVEGVVELGAGRQWQFASGTYIARWPAGGRLLLSRKLRLHNAAAVQLRGSATPLAALGLLDLAALSSGAHDNSTSGAHAHPAGAGRIAVMADSHCLDSASMADGDASSSSPSPSSSASSFCGAMAVDLVTYLAQGELPAAIASALQPPLAIPYAQGRLPPNLNAQNYSAVDVAAVRAQALREADKRMLEFVRYSRSAKLHSSSRSSSRCAAGFRARWGVSP